MTIITNLQAAYQDIFDNFKTTATLRTIERTRDSEDDITETPHNYTVDCVLMPIEDLYTDQPAGLIELGTDVAFFKADQSYVSVNNNVIKGSDTYNIIRVEKAEVAGTVIYQMAYLQKR